MCKFGGREGDCPVTERISDCLLRLPFYNTLTEDEQQQVIDSVLAFTPAALPACPVAQE
jgi:dTDP-4-amino-4,6-dideoxygalactose transaminase